MISQTRPKYNKYLCLKFDVTCFGLTIGRAEEDNFAQNIIRETLD